MKFTKDDLKDIIDRNIDKNKDLGIESLLAHQNKNNLPKEFIKIFIDNFIHNSIFYEELDKGVFVLGDFIREFAGNMLQNIDDPYIMGSVKNDVLSSEAQKELLNSIKELIELWMKRKLESL